MVCEKSGVMESDSESCGSSMTCMWGPKQEATVLVGIFIAFQVHSVQSRGRHTPWTPHRKGYSVCTQECCLSRL